MVLENSFLVTSIHTKNKVNQMLVVFTIFLLVSQGLC